MHQREPVLTDQRPRERRLFEHSAFLQPSPDLLAVPFAIRPSQHQMHVFSRTSYSRKGPSQNVEPLFEIEAPEENYQPTPVQLRELSHQALASSPVGFLKPLVFDSDISNNFLTCHSPVR